MARRFTVIAVLFFGAFLINAVESDPIPQEDNVKIENDVMVDPNNPNLRIHKMKGQWVTRIHRIRIPIPATDPVQPPVVVVPPPVGKPSTGDVPQSSLGCFRDSRQKRLLPSYEKGLDDNSPTRCIDLCLKSGYQYAGVQYGTECWCGNYKPLPEFNINDDFCNKACPKSPSEKCGGDLSMNVYYTRLPSDVPRSSLGCFRDSRQKRLLPGYEKGLEDNSPTRCIDLCLQSGFQYAGVQYGTECWCGNEKPLPEFSIYIDNCNKNCPKGSQEKCGGDLCMNVYYTGFQSDVSRSTLGCFGDLRQKRLLPSYEKGLENNSPTRCIDLCLQSGYQYAGVQYGTECWCGHEKPLQQYIINNNFCNKACPKSPSEKCGGDLSMNVYYTGLPSDVPRSTLGCFRDSRQNRLLPGYQKGLEDNSPTRCIDLCLQSGFQYAGVQYGTECWCGNEKPLPEFSLYIDSCNKNCPKGSQEKCGGDLSMNVFFTGMRSVPAAN